MYGLQEIHAGSVNILLDEPASNSGRLKALTAEIGENDPLTPDIQIMKEADRVLWEKENAITSDSVMPDHCRSWINLAARCVEKQNVQPLQVWESGSKEIP